MKERKLNITRYINYSHYFFKNKWNIPVVNFKSLLEEELLPAENEYSSAYVAQFLNRTTNTLMMKSLPFNNFYSTKSYCSFYFLTFRNSNVDWQPISDEKNFTVSADIVRNCWSVFNVTAECLWRLTITIQFSSMFDVAPTSHRRRDTGNPLGFPCLPTFYQLLKGTSKLSISYKTCWTQEIIDINEIESSQICIVNGSSFL